MTAALQAVDTYRKLADWHHNHGQPQHRDRFLVLAADSAFADGRTDEAERLRQRLLRFTPHHLLKPYASFGQALNASDVQTYLSDLRRSYPVHVAADLLASLPGKKDAGPPKVSTMLPPTQPVIDLGTPADGAEAVDTLKVYSLKREEEPEAILRPKTQIGPATVPIRKPTQAKAPSPVTPYRAAPPVARPSLFQPIPEPMESRLPRSTGWTPPAAESDGAISSGLCAGMAAAMAVVSFALAGYALIGPIMGRN